MIAIRWDGVDGVRIRFRCIACDRPDTPLTTTVVEVETRARGFGGDTYLCGPCLSELVRGLAVAE